MATPADNNQDHVDDPPSSPTDNAPDESLQSTIAVLVKMQRAYLDVQSNRDRLQHEEEVKRLENEDIQNKRLHLSTRLGIGTIGFLLTFVLIMAFFGDERQSAVALQVLNISGLAMGGAGGMFLAWVVGSRLIRR